MMRIVVVLLLTQCLAACSLMERNHGPADESPTAKRASLGMEGDVARLNSKVEALETKLDVLTSTLEKMQLKSSQPQIMAEASPAAGANMAPTATNNLALRETKEAAPITNAAAEETPIAVPVVAPMSSAKQAALEKEFQDGMELFQSGKNMEAANAFSSFAKHHEGHVLAAHSLYWAGEAYARNQQWTQAQESWQELENNYPHTTYIPEALAGLARSYEAQGDMPHAKAYKDTLMRAFPNAPATMNVLTHEPVPAKEPQEEKTADDGKDSDDNNANE